MAVPITLQGLIDAGIDAGSLSEFLESTSLTMTTRLGTIKKTLSGLEFDWDASLSAREIGWDASFEQKKAEADESIASYKIKPKGNYADGPVLLSDGFEYVTFAGDGRDYFAISPPYDTRPGLFPDPALDTANLISQSYILRSEAESLAQEQAHAGDSQIIGHIWPINSNDSVAAGQDISVSSTVVRDASLGVLYKSSGDLFGVVNSVDFDGLTITVNGVQFDLFRMVNGSILADEASINLITPALAELIMNTQTNELILGDGSRQGGHVIGNLLNVTAMGAVPDNATDSGAAINAALATGRSIFISGQFYTTQQISPKFEGQQIVFDNNVTSWIRGEASLNPVVLMDKWHSQLVKPYVLGGVTGIQVGTVLIKANFVALIDGHTKDCSATGLKVVNGNVGRIIGGMYENSDVNVHFTDDAIDTNGWTILGPRAFGGRRNFWFQGDIDGRFVDDNFITLTSEGYTEHGVVLNGRRNVMFVYAESSEPNTYAILDESVSKSGNYVVLTGNADVDPAGTFHGLQQGVSPVYHMLGERMRGEQQTIDLSLSAKSHQIIGFRNNTTVINNGGSTNQLLVQKLSEREKNNPFYLTLPASNTGGVTVVLDDPGFTFTDGSTNRVYKAQGAVLFVELQKTDDTTFSINLLNSERQPVGSDSVILTASTSFFLSNYRDDDQMIDIQNPSGSTRNLTVSEGTVVPLGYQITYVHSSGPNIITLVLDGMTFKDGTTSRSMILGDVLKLQKVSDTVFAVYESI